MSSSFRRAGRPAAAATAATAAASAAHEQEAPSASPAPTDDGGASAPEEGGGSSAAPPLSVAPRPTTTMTTTTQPLRLRGTKPWTGGLTLTSSGLREIDAIFGGGQPLGTAVLVEEDRWTADLGPCLARYWAAEAVSHGQILVLPATRPDEPPSLPTTPPPFDADDYHRAEKDDDVDNDDMGGSSPSDLRNFVRALPRDLHLDKFRSRAERDSSSSSQDDAAATEPDVESRRRRRRAHDDLSAPFAIIEEEEFEDEEEGDDEGGHSHRRKDVDDAEEGLRIAWQYRTSVQRERLGHHGGSSSRPSGDPEANKSPGGEVYCHSYDLAGRMIDQHPPGWFSEEEEEGGHLSPSGIDVADSSSGPCRQTSRKCGFGLFRRLLGRVLRHLSSDGRGRFDDGGVGTTNNVVVRVLLLDAPIPAAAVALPLLLAYVRARSLPVVVMVTVRPWRCLGGGRAATAAAALTSLRRASDVVLAAEGLASLRDKPPPEFKDLAGVLTIRKMAAMGGGHFADATAGRGRPPADRYGMRRDRRKLHVRLLHLPPEEGSAGGSSTSGVRSGGGLRRETAPASASPAATTALEPGAGCGSSSGRRGGGGNASLDF